MNNVKGQVFHVKTEEQFEDLVNNTKKYNVTVYVKFSATWCGPCKKIQPLYEKLAGMYPNSIFACVDTGDLEDLCESYNVTSLPTFSRIRNGQYQQLFKGANEQMLVQVVQNDNKPQ